MIQRLLKAGLAAVLYYTGALWLLRRLAARRGEALIVTYHAVDADLSGACPAEVEAGLVVSRSTLHRQLRHLARRYRMVGLNELARAAAGDGSAGGLCAVTFDDGLAGLVEHALPVLTELGVPATVFVPSDYVGDSGELPALRLRRAIWAGGGSSQAAERHKRLGRDGVIAASEAIERSLSADQRAALARLTPRCVMGSDDLVQVMQAGVTLGSHGRVHDPLPQLSPEAQRAELTGSKMALETLTGCAPTCFCYPHGAADRSTAALAKEAGYLCACTTRQGSVRAGDNLHLLRRIALDENTSKGVGWAFSPSRFEAAVRMRARRGKR
jgi:peptidoglycan/xylan/chitin deacetylase (PgdA/CDA1 family)